MKRVLGNILCELDPKVKVKGKKAGICNGWCTVDFYSSFLFCLRFYVPVNSYCHFQTQFTLPKF